MSDEDKEIVSYPSAGKMRGLQKDGRIDADVAEDEADPKTSHLGLPRMSGEGNASEDVNRLVDSYLHEDE